VLDLYSYTRPDVFGLPFWILGSYIGGPGKRQSGTKVPGPVGALTQPGEVACSYSHPSKESDFYEKG